MSDEPIVQRLDAIQLTSDHRAEQLLSYRELRPQIETAGVSWTQLEHQAAHLGYRHQPTRRKEKSLIKFKSPKGVQQLLSLMGKVRNLFAVFVNRYKHKAPLRRHLFDAAKSILDNAASRILAI